MRDCELYLVRRRLETDRTDAIQSVVVTGHFITGTNSAIAISIYGTMQNQ